MTARIESPFTLKTSGLWRTMEHIVVHSVHKSKADGPHARYRQDDANARELRQLAKLGYIRIWHPITLKPLTCAVVTEAGAIALAAVHLGLLETNMESASRLQTERMTKGALMDLADARLRGVPAPSSVAMFLGDKMADLALPDEKTRKAILSENAKRWNKKQSDELDAIAGATVSALVKKPIKLGNSGSVGFKRRKFTKKEQANLQKFKNALADYGAYLAWPYVKDRKKKDTEVQVLLRKGEVTLKRDGHAATWIGTPRELADALAEQFHWPYLHKNK